MSELVMTEQISDPRICLWPCPQGLWCLQPSGGKAVRWAAFTCGVRWQGENCPLGTASMGVRGQRQLCRWEE